MNAGGGTGWYMDLFTNHSKPCSIGQKQSPTAETTDNRYTVPSFVLVSTTVVRGDPVCRKEDCSQYDVGLVFKEISSCSDQDKLKFIEHV